MNAVFTNRRDVGQKLAQQLIDHTNNLDTVVLALPRGGVPVAYEVAKKLNLPFDVCLVRKIGLPDSPETAMGAIAENALLPNDSDYITIIDRDMTKNYRVKQSEIQAIAAREKAEIRWRETCYRHYRPMLGIADRTVIVVDDGMATGLTMQAAVKALSTHQPMEIIVAVPVASWQAIAVALKDSLRIAKQVLRTQLAEGIAKLESQVDDLICLETPKAIGALGFWYEDFTQVSDREVCDLLSKKSIRLVVSR